MISTRNAAEKWLKEKEKNLTPKSYEMCKDEINLFLLRFNNTFLCQIIKEDCESFFNDFYVGKSKSTKTRAIRDIKQFFKWAIKENHITDNPMDDIPLLLSEKKKKKIPKITIEEIKKMLSAAKNAEFLPYSKNTSQDYTKKMYYTALCLSIMCCLHKGELYALTWDCIGEDYIIIKKNAQFLKNKIEFIDITKPNGQRKIQLFPETKMILNNWKVCQNEYKKSHTDFNNKNNLIFANIKGNIMDEKNMTKRWWNPLRKYLQMEYVKWQNLRDISILFWYDRKVPINKIHAYLGNTDIRTTLSTLEAGGRI